jgi:hypothetical protein
MIIATLIPAVGFWSLIILGLGKFRDIPRMQARCNKLELQCYGRDRDFWDGVQKTFGETRRPKT